MVIGRVVDAQSTAPVSDAVVALSGVGSVSRCLTDARGQFAFVNLPKGRYELSASVGGNGYGPNGFVVTGAGFPIGAYQPGEFGQRRPGGPSLPLDLDDGARIGDAVIRLWRSAAISGVVVDDAGEPQIDQVVGVVRVTSDGRLLTGPTARTDDRGAYRFSVVPGTYLVFVPETQLLIPTTSVAALADPTDLAATTRLANTGAPAERDGVTVGSSRLVVGADRMVANSLALRPNGSRWLWTPTTFAPSATVAASAARYSVKAGEERSGVTVRVQPVATFAVSGTLSDESGPAPGFGVHLLPAEGDDGSSILEVARTSTDSVGRFVFPAVPPGAYRVVSYRIAPAPGQGQPAPPPRTTSEQPGAWASVPVTVGGDVSGVALMMRAGLSLDGDLMFDGSSPVPAPSRVGPALSLALARPTFRYEGSPRPSVTIDAGNRVSIRGIPPGRYVLGVTDLGGWSLESVTLGGRDVTDAAFVVDTSDPLPRLTITLTDHPATVAGAVFDGRGSPTPEATVLIFPSDRERWPDARASTRTFLEARTGTGGRFAFAQVPPGEYFVAAVDSASDGAWPDVALLGRVATGATAARVRSGQSSGLTLKVLDIK